MEESTFDFGVCALLIFGDRVYGGVVTLFRKGRVFSKGLLERVIDCGTRMVRSEIRHNEWLREALST